VNGRQDPVDADEELLARPAPSGRRRTAYAAGAVLLGVGVAAGLLTRGHGDHRQAQPPPGPNTVAPQPGPSTSAGPDPVIRTADLPDIGPVQLYARAANAVVRLDFAAGRVITTELPALRSSGPVTFGVTDTGAYVRPIDAVPGYFVPDGAPARDLTGVLAAAAVLPGPDARSVWVEESDADGLTALRAVSVPSSATSSAFLPVPAAYRPYWTPPQPDGAGFVLISGAHGSFDLRPDGAYRLPVDLLNGTLLATGGGRILVAECSPLQQRSCPTALVRLPDGARDSVGSLPVTASLPRGVISPDARTALIYQPATAGRIAARVIDLATGRPRGAPVPVDSDVLPGSAAYSGDGRWVFLVGTDGTLILVDARTGVARQIDVQLPFLYQLATTAGHVTSPDSTIRMYLQTNSYERISACSSPRPTTPTRSSNAIRSRC